MKKHSRALTLISLLIGAALFVWLIRQAGLSEILARVRALGAGFILILMISAVRQFVRAVAWLRCMMPEDRNVGWLALLKARLAGDAIGDLTTAGPLIAEPLKVITLGAKLSTSTRISSLAVENLAYAFSSCVMVMAGTLSLLAAFAVSASLRVASWMAFGAVLVVLISSMVIVRRRWRVLSGLGEMARRALNHEGRWEEKLKRVRELEEYVFDFYANRPGDFFLVMLCDTTFHLTGVVEVYVTLKLIGYAPSLMAAFILEAVNRVINIVFAFVPAMIGVDEAGTGWLANTLGLGATAGLTLAIIRKGRMFFWIALGLVFLAAGQKERQKAKGKRQKSKVRSELLLVFMTGCFPYSIFAFCLLPFAF